MIHCYPLTLNMPQPKYSAVPSLWLSLLSPAHRMSHDIHGRENLADDFDLWWGVGPTRNNEKRQSTGHVGDMSTGVTPQAGATTVIGGSRALGGSGSLNPNPAPLMGSLWSHGGEPTHEAYGHRHHVHGHQGDITETIVQQPGSPPPPPPVSTRRPAWLPPPSQHHQHSTRGASGRAGPGSNLGQHHHEPASPRRGVIDDSTAGGGGGGGRGGG